MYRYRTLDTRVGTIGLAIPKLRTAATIPDWRLERGKRAESALITVVADLLPRRRVHLPHGQARQGPGRRLAVEVLGQLHGQRAGRACRLVPPPVD